MRPNGSRADVFSFSSSTSRYRWVGLIALLIVYVAALPAYSVAQQRTSLQQTPRAVREGTAQLVGHYDSAQMLRLVFALKPPHLEEEEQFLNQLQDKDSPLFHKYLSEKEWDERFAPSVQDEQAVVAWVQSQGLTVTQRFPNRLLVDVEAPVAIIEKALDVAIKRYQLGSASYYSNDRDPAIPRQFVGLVHAVLGLNNLEVMHSASRNIQAVRGPDYSPGPAFTVGSHLTSDANRKKPGVAPSRREKPLNWEYLYWPRDLWAPGAYNYGGNEGYRGGLSNLGHCCNPLNNPNNSPPEASIAIAIWGDYSDSDFQTFIGGNILAGNIQRYFVDGTPSCCNPETTLDAEYATAMANSFSSSANTAEIHVYEGINNHFSTMLDVLNQALSDGHARVLSMSWGAAEIYEAPSTVMDSYHAVFDQMSGQGWTLVAGSGDGGATSDCADHLSVIYPGSDPDVTAAGGTTLGGGSYGYVFETGWTGGSYGCSNNDGGGGGGCSAYFSAPSYQGTPACGANSRSLPDLALNADAANTPQIFYLGGWTPTGGTSIVAPEIAGFYAQANAYLLYIQSIVGNTCGSSYSAPCAPLGNANRYLYAEGYGQFAPHYPFYDITSGCNDNDITRQYGLTPFCAVPGYDMVTGWGSANMLQLSWMINAFVAGDFGAPVTTIGGPQPNHWYTTDQMISWTITDTSANGHPPMEYRAMTLLGTWTPGTLIANPRRLSKVSLLTPSTTVPITPTVRTACCTSPGCPTAKVAIRCLCGHGTMPGNQALPPTVRCAMTPGHRIPTPR
jgi:subtilase family serine protease